MGLIDLPGPLLVLFHLLRGLVIHQGPAFLLGDLLADLDLTGEFLHDYLDLLDTRTALGLLRGSGDGGVRVGVRVGVVVAVCYSE